MVVHSFNVSVQVSGIYASKCDVDPFGEVLGPFVRGEGEGRLSATKVGLVAGVWVVGVDELWVVVALCVTNGVGVVVCEEEGLPGFQAVRDASVEWARLVLVVRAVDHVCEQRGIVVHMGRADKTFLIFLYVTGRLRSVVFGAGSYMCVRFTRQGVAPCVADARRVVTFMVVTPVRLFRWVGSVLPVVLLLWWFVESVRCFVDAQRAVFPAVSGGANVVFADAVLHMDSGLRTEDGGPRERVILVVSIDQRGVFVRSKGLPVGLVRILCFRLVNLLVRCNDVSATIQRVPVNVEVSDAPVRLVNVARYVLPHGLAVVDNAALVVVFHALFVVALYVYSLAMDVTIFPWLVGGVLGLVTAIAANECVDGVRRDSCAGAVVVLIVCAFAWVVEAVIDRVVDAGRVIVRVRVYPVTVTVIRYSWCDRDASTAVRPTATRVRVRTGVYRKPAVFGNPIVVWPVVWWVVTVIRQAGRDVSSAFRTAGTVVRA